LYRFGIPYIQQSSAINIGVNSPHRYTMNTMILTFKLQRGEGDLHVDKRWVPNCGEGDLHVDKRWVPNYVVTL